MIIYNDFFKIEIKDNKVYYNLNEILHNDYNELYEIMLKFISKKKIDKLFLKGKYEPLKDIERIIFLVLSNFYVSIYSVDYNKNLDITFSYHFPIYNQKWIIKRLLNIGNKAFNSNMIALADSKDYIEYDVSNKESYDNFYKKRGRLIRKGDLIYDLRTNELSSTLNYWNEYCINKHNKKFSDDDLEIYKDIYSTFGFNSIKLLLNGEIVLESIYFKDTLNKIIYFCILAWDEKFKNLSPGIYIYSKGIEFCYKNNYKFSFCYGLQNYKIDLLKEFEVDND